MQVIEIVDILNAFPQTLNGFPASICFHCFPTQAPKISVSRPHPRAVAEVLEAAPQVEAAGREPPLAQDMGDFTNNPIGSRENLQETMFFYH